MGLGKTYSTQYLLDSNNNSGVAGQVLSTTSTGIDWVDANTVPGSGLWLESGNDIYNSNSGNVGIGVTAPTSSVHVNGLQTNSGSTSAHIPTGTMRLNFAGASSPDEYGASLVFTQRWWTGSTGEVAMGQITGVKETGDGNYGGGLAFFTSNNTSNNLLERLRINELGNVGIGTTSPGYKLDVTGDARFGDGNNFNPLIQYAGSGRVAASPGYSFVGDLDTGMFNPNLGNTLAFTTAGAERMRIDSSGNVGIGVTGPLSKLHVNGGNISIQNVDSSSPYTASGKLRFLGRYDRYLGGINTVNTGSYAEYDNGLDFYVQRDTFDAAGHFAMRINHLSNVGIGTISPDVRLEVVEASPTDGIVADFVNSTNAGGTTAAIKLSNADSEACDVVLGANRVGANFGSDFFISLSDGVDGSNQERFRITEAGNVGIGTATPATELQIGDYTDATETITIATSDNGAGRINFYDQNDTEGGSIRVVGQNLGSKMYFSNRWNTDNDRVVFDLTTGNVGIGTTSPGAKLDVIGTIKAGNSGTSRFTDTSALPLQLSRGLDVDVYGANGASLGIGSLKGTTYIDAARFSVALAVNGTDGTMSLQTLGSGAYSTAITLNSAQAVRFNAYGAGTLVTDASGNITVSSGGGAGGPYLPLSAGSSYPLTGDLYLGAFNKISGVTGDNLVIGVDINNSSGASSFDIQMDGSTSAFYINNSRNVGIGETSPSSKLVVAENINPAITILDTTTIPAGTQNAGNNITFGTLQFQWGAESYSYMPSIEARFNETDASFGRKAGLDFKVGNIASVTAMSILSSGEVGIGTTSPSNPLEISSDTSTSLVYQRTGVSANKWGFHSDNDATYWQNVTSGSLLFTLQNGGNVGIGTTSPDSKLDVTGGDITVNTSGTGFMNFKYGAVGSETARGSITTDGIDLKVNATADLLLLPTGNVGIGTVSPGATLDVVGVGLSTLFRVSNTETDATTKYGTFMGRHYTNSEENIAGMLLTSSSNGLTGNRVSIGGGISAANAVNEIIFYTALNNTTLSGSERMRITNSGNVGIGMTTPYTKLVIGSRGTAAATSISAYDGIAFDFYNDGSPYKRHGVIISQAGDASESVLDFNTKAASGTNSTKMTILGNGNVGIGTTSPGAKLDVSDGTIYSIKLSNSAAYNSGINNGIVFNGKYTSGGNVTDMASVRGGKENTADGNFGGKLTFHTRQNGGVDTERMRIDDIGRVGIGTDDPIYTLDVVSTGDGLLSLTGGTKPAMIFKVGTAVVGGIQAQANTSLNVSAYGTSSLNLQTAGTTPRLTILTGGNVGIGIETPGSLLEIEGATNSSTSNLLRLSRASQGSAPEKVAGFYSGTSGERGYITVSNFATAYNTSSDYRLKENIKPIEDSVERLMSLKPCNFNFISEEEDKIVMDGFIAHEAKDVVPEAVTGIKDAVDEKGNPMYQGIDQSKIVPLLTAALQQALQRIEILEQKINN